MVLCDFPLLFSPVNIWKEGTRIYAAFAFVVVKNMKIMGIGSTMVVKFILSYLHTLGLGVKYGKFFFIKNNLCEIKRLYSYF